MKKLFLSLLMLIAISAVAQDRVSRIREKLLNCDYSSVIVASHRGDWRNFPENSLEAIDNAIKMGVDIVELDVQRTKACFRWIFFWMLQILLFITLRHEMPEKLTCIIHM